MHEPAINVAARDMHALQRGARTQRVNGESAYADAGRVPPSLQRCNDTSAVPMHAACWFLRKDVCQKARAFCEPRHARVATSACRRFGNLAADGADHARAEASWSTDFAADEEGGSSSKGGIALRDCIEGAMGRHAPKTGAGSRLEFSR